MAYKINWPVALGLAGLAWYAEIPQYAFAVFNKEATITNVQTDMALPANSMKLPLALGGAVALTYFKGAPVRKTARRMRVSRKK